jgi:multidrug efflux pump subunit AcrA (membrane-fusion protein)
MDVHDKIDEIVKFLESARTMPMSSSAVVNRPELLGMLEEVRGMLPSNLRAAEAVLDQREALLAEARANAERLIATGQQEQERLVSEHGVLVAAEAKAEQTTAAAALRSEELRRQVDDYVDAKLAHLEVQVDKILDTVRQGRDRLRVTSSYDELGAVEEPLPD